MFSRKIAILVPDMTNQFFSELAQQVQRHIVSVNGAGIILSSDGKRDLEARNVELVASLGVDGLVFISVGDNYAVYDILAGGSLPYVVLDREVPDSPNCDFVLSDNVYGTRLIVEYLVAQGHREVGYVAGDLTTEPGRARKETFVRALGEAGLVVPPAWLFDGDFSFRSGHVAGESLLRQTSWPTAIACANDFMAVGLIQALSEAGVRVPDKIGIVGYDDIPLAGWIYPRLTTVRQEVGELAREAVAVLVQRIDRKLSGDSDELPPQLRPVIPRLIIRDSLKGA